MNVTELARKLKITPNKLKEIMPLIGFDIGFKAIKVDPKMAQAILEKMSDPAMREKYLSDSVVEIKKETSREKGGSDTEQFRQVEIPERIVVKELARRMNVAPANLILELMKSGVMAPLNQYIDFETASIIAEDMGYAVVKTEEEMEKEKEIDSKSMLGIKEETASERPPIIVVMGHVDHGKTKLLDAIRQTNIMEGEAGGITQHIGAYQVEKDGRLLTFIDTPGHEAFSAMRSRGAKVADIAILLVAADDGVQPQTIEALAHIRKAELPFIVAINKIDKPGANVDKVKTDLANIGLTPEDWGGKTICVEVSAKEKINIPLLLENLFLTADLNKDTIVANVDAPAAGTIVETHIDKGEGPVATVLIQNGVLRRNDLVRIGEVPGKIRLMKNWKGELVDEAVPSMPVKILGLKAVPGVGDILQVMGNQKEMRRLTKTRVKEFSKATTVGLGTAEKNKEDEDDEQKPRVRIILKSDVLGSVEAIIESLDKVHKRGVGVEIIKQGLGNITEKDIEQAGGLSAVVLGFNVKITPEAKRLAVDKKVEAEVFGVIYDLLDFIEKKVVELAGVEIIEKEIGRLRVLAIFRTEKKEQIIGGRVESGKAIGGARAKVERKGEIIGQVEVRGVESGRTKVKEVAEGQECGLCIEGKLSVEKNDQLKIFVVEEEKKHEG
ncbi:translation initiation factor IF-2 [Candidatus Kuenenbacteria bacterium]|nr:translation initiation factor IF-2 [Candidatus Kuenenbacteria bacterium]